MTLAVARPGVAIASVGAARRAFDIALEYCNNRIQGGCRLSEHQHVQARLARVATEFETARSFALMPFILAEETNFPNTQLAIMAKIQCSEMACRIISECMQLLGGNGYISDHGLEKLYRDIKLNCIYEGENEFLSILLGRMITQ